MNNLKKTATWLATFVVGLGLMTMPVRAQYVGPENGQTVAFVGDSITAFATGPDGWVTLVTQVLEQNGKKIGVIPRGYPGTTSRDMLSCMSIVIGYKPDWMTLSCGVNDVWHTGPTAVPLEEYKKNVTSIVDQATAAHIKVIILTPTMIGENQPDPANQKLIAYIDFLRELAAQRHLLIADLNADMQASVARIKAQNPKIKGFLLTKDNVHPIGAGNEVMAAGVLKAFGFTDAQLTKIKESWLDLPGGFPLRLVHQLTMGQYLQLRAMASDQGHTVEEMLAEDMAKDVKEHLSASPSSAIAKP